MTDIPFLMLDDKNSALPLYRQIYEGVRLAILNGKLSSGTRLTASRVLAKQLSVSRLTVVNAFEQLLAEGYLEGKNGSGTFVASKIPEDLLQISEAEKKNKTAEAAKRKSKDLEICRAFDRDKYPCFAFSKFDRAAAVQKTV